MTFIELMNLMSDFKNNHKDYGMPCEFIFDIQVFDDFSYIINIDYFLNYPIKICPSEEFTQYEWIQDWGNLLLSKENKEKIVEKVCSKLSLTISK